jgi:hypothetical protein
MTLPIILGADEMTLSKVPRTWNYSSGEVTRYVSRGPRAKGFEQYQLYKTVNAFKPVYDSIEYDPGRGISTVIATVVEDAETVYEMLADKLMKPIEQSDYYALEETPLTGQQIDDVIVAFKFGTKPPLTFWVAKQNELFTDLSYGITEIEMTRFVLRETKTVSKRSTVKADYANCNRVCELPDTSAVNSLMNMVDIPTGEWKKDTPQTRTFGSKKWQITTEWQWALAWSKRHYGGTWDPKLTV